MSEFDGKKPETREEFIRMLRVAKKKERETRKAKRRRSTKPTIKGTAEIIGVHRDTLYRWMSDFNVDFDDVPEKPESVRVTEKSTYLIGEALTG